TTMKQQPTLSQEHLSALADGELQGDALTQTLQALNSDAQALHTWHAYHVVGDVMRSAELAPQCDGLAFLQQFEQRLAQEPGIVGRAQDATAAQPVQLAASNPAANAPQWNWKRLAAVACSAVVGVVGWGQWSQIAAPQGTALSAAATKPAPTVPPAQVADGNGAVMLRDPALDSLLAAHQQLGGHSALQRPSGFLRNATFEGPNR
ncbi:MAG: sigma-E factor negative regulatory protein, partial [Rhodoferax sp.]